MEARFYILGGKNEQTGDFISQNGGFSIRQKLPFPSQNAQSWIVDSSFRYGGYYLRGCSQALFSADKNGSTYENLNIDYVTRGVGFSFSDGNGNATTGNLSTIKQVLITPSNKTFYFYAPSFTVNLPTSINTDAAGNITTNCSDVAFNLCYVYGGKTRHEETRKYEQQETERNCVFYQPAGYYSDSVDDYLNGVCRFANVDGAAISRETSYSSCRIYTFPSYAYNKIPSVPSWSNIEGSRGFFFKSAVDVVLYNYVYGTVWDVLNKPCYLNKAYVKLIFE